jgi:hypothetical protein
MDSYCTGSIVGRILLAPEKVFKCYEEDWESAQFTDKGDDLHAARITAKYRVLKYIDSDNPDQCGEFRKVGCAFLKKCAKSTETKKRKERGTFTLSWDVLRAMIMN